MKKYILSTLLLFIASFGFSQFNVGLRGGLTSSQLKVSETADGIKLTTGDNTFGYLLGAYSQIIIKDKFIIMPEAVFSNSGGNIDLSDGTDFKEIWNLSFNRLDFPVNFGWRFLKIFRVNAGPYASLLLSADARYANIDQDVKDNYKNLSWGYQAGLGVDFWRFAIDFKYEGSFESTHEGYTNIPGTDTQLNPDIRPNQWILALGIKLF
jgi:hypothetical protein